MLQVSVSEVSGLLFFALSACAHPTPSEAEVDALSRALAVNEQATVADIGAGRGRFAIALARRVVPRGTVLATEIDSDLRRSIRKAAKKAGLTHVSVVKAEEKRTGLSPGCCDAILMRRVYHHLTQPEPTLQDIVRALRPGGRFVVVDFLPSGSTPEGLPEDRDGHGIRPEMVVREVGAAGLTLVERIEPWPGSRDSDDFALVFVRDGAEPSAGEH